VVQIRHEDVFLNQRLGLTNPMKRGSHSEKFGILMRA
jgi:hypothetical protein